MGFSKVLFGSELLATIRHEPKEMVRRNIHTPNSMSRSYESEKSVLLRTRIRSCDIFKKSEFRNIWIALYLSMNVIINIKINWWTEERFFYWYTLIPLPTSLKTRISFFQTATLLGLFIYFVSQKFCPIKHQICWEAAIIMWSRIIPSVQARTLSPAPAGYKMANVYVGTCACPFPLFSNRPVLCAGGRNGQVPETPSQLADGRLIPGRLLHLNKRGINN